MASVRPRPRADGSTGYTVMWREGSRQVSRTADTIEDANLIKALVEKHGHFPESLNSRAAVGETTVAELCEAWVQDREKRVRSDRTIADYRRDIKAWIVPEFGHLPASGLEDWMVQEWVDGIPRAPKTVANIHGILSASYKWGAHKRVDGRYLVTGNPCHSTELPTRERKVRGLRAGEWAILYQAACEVGPDAADVLLFLVGTGWRWSEMSAIQVWQFIDGPKPSVEMAGVFRRNAASQHVLVDDAKSDAGHGRRVRLSPRVADLMRRRVTGKALGEFVFTAPDGGPLRYSNFHHRVWGKPDTGILARAKRMGLRADPTMHWLRHTQAALLIEAGANLPAVQRRLGHESITTTVDTYGRLVDDVDSDILDALDGELFRRANVRAVGD